MCGGGVDEPPVRADKSRGQVLREATHEVGAEDLRVSEQLGLLRGVEAEGVEVGERRPCLVTQGPLAQRINLIC